MTEELHRRRSHRQPSRLRQLWGRYSFEVIWALVVVFGIFLIFERMNIRRSLFNWLSKVAQALLRGAGQLGDTTLERLAAITLSDAIGLLLVLGALLAIVLRTRWRLLTNPALSTELCPKCQGPIHRVHRTRLDHVINIFVPVRRFRCANHECRWKGLRIHSKRTVSRRPATLATTKPR